MGARDERLRRELVPGAELDPLGAAGDRAEVARHDRDVGLGLVLEDPQLGVAVRVVGAMPVEVVGLEVEQHRDARANAVNVLELEAGELAYDPRTAVDRAVEARQRAPDVAGDGDRLSGGAEDRPQQFAGRRLPVRSGDADERVAQKPEAELDLAPHGDAAGARSGRQRRLSRHTRALDEQVDSLEQTFLLRPGVDFDTGFGKPPGVDRRRPVDGDRRDATACECERCRLTRSRETDDECASRQLHGFTAVR